MERELKKKNHQAEEQEEPNERVSFRMNEMKRALNEIRTTRWRKREEASGAKRQKISEEAAGHSSLPGPKLSASDRGAANLRSKTRKSVSLNSNGDVQELYESIGRLSLLVSSPTLPKKMPSEIVERKKKKKKSARARKQDSKFLRLRDDFCSSSDSDSESKRRNKC